jgi:MYXO-CTERM domain-containing protein
MTVRRRRGHFGGVGWIALCALAALCVLASSAAWTAMPRDGSEAATRTVQQGTARARAQAAAPHAARATAKLPAGVDLASVMRRVHLAFRPDGGALVGGGATYAVSARDGVVELTARHEGSAPATLRLSTARASRAGAATVAAIEQRVDARGALAIARGGVVETWSNRDAESEQAWRFEARPEGRGDLTVEVAASGLAYAGTTATGLHFADARGVGFRYGHATWIDAAGARVAVPARYERDRGVIALRVPRDVVDGAAYPAVLDPSVGPEIGVDAPVTVQAAQSQALNSVVFDGTNYFVAWADLRPNQTSDGEDVTGAIYGTRVTPAGTLLDPQGILIASGSYLGTPRVSSDGADYLVVWEQDTADGFRVRAARVSSTGSASGPIGVPLAAGALSQVEPVVAFDGTHYLVAWCESTQPSTQEMRAARIGVDGTVLDAPALVLPTSGDSASPAIAFDGTNYLVVWQETSLGSGDIHGVRVSPAGGVLDLAPIPISAAVNAQQEPVVAFDGTNYLVAWTDGRSGVGTNVYAARVDPDGDVLDGNGVQLCSASHGQSTPAVAFDGAGYLVVWQDTRQPESFEIYGTRVTPAGAALDADGVLLSSGHAGHYAGRPSLAFDGTNYLAIWSDDILDMGDVDTVVDVVGARVDTSAQRVDATDLVISQGPNEEHEPAVAFDGTNYLAVWKDSRNGNDDIYAARLSAEGELLDASGIAVSTADKVQRTPRVAFGDDTFLVVWQDFRNGFDNADIYGARVSTAGALLDASGIALTTAANEQRAPAVEFGSDDFLVVWSDGRDSANDEIYGTRVSTAGAVLDAAGIAVTSGATFAATPALAFDGTNYLVVWSQLDGAANTGIYAARVSAAGAVLDAPSFPVTTASGDQNTPSVAFNGTNFLVVWADFRNGATSDVYGARVTTAGVRLDASGIVIANAAGAQERPVVVFDGRESFVTWQDTRGGHSDDVYGARVRVNGAVRDPNGFVVSAQATHDAAPAVAFSANGVGMVFYQRADPDLAFTYRAKARALCTRGAVAVETACDGEDEDCDGVADDDGVCDPPPAPDEDAGQAEEEDAGADNDWPPAQPDEPGTGGTGAAGMDPGVATRPDAGAPDRPDAGTPPAGSETNDAGAAHAPKGPTKSDSGCDCSIERADRPTPFALLAAGLLATARVIRRRRRRR